MLSVIRTPGAHHFCAAVFPLMPLSIKFVLAEIDGITQVGRTARQGQSGQVTSLYSPDRKPLADAVKAAIQADRPIEGAFSRNRSFSKKYKKYGQYVPRGQTGPQLNFDA